MRDRKAPPLATVVAGLALFAVCSATLGQNAPKANTLSATTLMALLGRFTAAGVPASRRSAPC